MVPNNNLSVLPWYTSIEEQNARKWWIYGKIYPLFTPAGYILPFQVMRVHRTGLIPTGEPGPQQDYDIGYLTEQGEWEQDTNEYGVAEYDVTGLTQLYFKNIPETHPNGVMAVALDEDYNNLGTFAPDFVGRFNGGWELPAGTVKLWIQIYNGKFEEPGEVYEATTGIAPIERVNIYNKNGVYVTQFSQEALETITIVPIITTGVFPSYDVIVFPGDSAVFASMDNGQYYAEMGDSVETWYSDVFTVVNDMSGYLKLEWWDTENFVMDAGTIVYENPEFKNVLYLCSDIAKPEYEFDDEVIERGGYTFPVQQISKKRYRFSFLASEYLLDVMRFVRMADYAEITKDGKRYSLDTFLITPNWEDNGDVAAVDAEFTTATVAKKIGVGYIKAQRNDLNDDFNND